MTDDLVAFLRARLDEDEQAALKATDGVADHLLPEDRSWADPTGALTRQAADWVSAKWLFSSRVVAKIEGWNEISISEGDTKIAEHIARHDPARVLREVEAKRRIIAELWDLDEGFATDHTAPRTAKAVLRLMALPYADHPDYHEDWRPS